MNNQVMVDRELLERVIDRLAKAQIFGLCDQLRPLLATPAPVAKPRVVMPEREGGHAQKSFWAGFEVARMRPEESNIRAAWNEFIASEQFARLNAAGCE
jgi:hypothetical protein